MNVNILYNTLLYFRLFKIIITFKSNNVDTVILKGVFLTEKVYKNIGLRETGDIDLLIRKRNLKLIERIIDGINYISPYFDQIKNNHYDFQKYSSEVSIYNDKIPIELHWHLVPNKIYKLATNIDMDEN